MSVPAQSQITVYHGSNTLFDAIDFTKSRDNRDFGRGFYTTTLYEQARLWAQNISIRHGGSQFVYEYVFTPDETLKVKWFDGLTVEWLDMVERKPSAWRYPACL